MEAVPGLGPEQGASASRGHPNPPQADGKTSQSTRPQGEGFGAEEHGEAMAINTVAAGRQSWGCQVKQTHPCPGQRARAQQAAQDGCPASPTQPTPCASQRHSSAMVGEMVRCDLPCGGTSHGSTTTTLRSCLLQGPSLQHRLGTIYGELKSLALGLSSHIRLLVLLLLRFKVSQHRRYLYRGGCPPHAVSQMHFGSCSQPGAFPAPFSRQQRRGAGLPAPAGHQAEGL